MKKTIIYIFIIFSFCYFISGQVQKVSSPFSQAKFVPNISAILDFSYLHRDLKDWEMDRFYLPGYYTIEDHYDNGPQGFSLNYLELAIDSVVDPFFDLFAVFQFIDGEFSIEEAYFKTRSLPSGFQLKGGKFFSGFGRLNSMHDHVWNFSDQPLVYQGIFGAVNLNDLGIQLNWVAPTDLFINIGIEWFQGQNSVSGSFLNRDMQIGENLIEKSSKPHLITFVKSSVDIGNLVVLGGISLATGHINRYYQDTGYGLSGQNQVLGVDFTFKYLIDSYRYINLQNEYMIRRFDGDRVSELESTHIQRDHQGFYSELVWRYSQRWRWGARYDYLQGGMICT